MSNSKRSNRGRVYIPIEFREFRIKQDEFSEMFYDLIYAVGLVVKDKTGNRKFLGEHVEKLEKEKCIAKKYNVSTGEVKKYIAEKSEAYIRLFRCSDDVPHVSLRVSKKQISKLVQKTSKKHRKKTKLNLMMYIKKGRKITVHLATIIYTCLYELYENLSKENEGIPFKEYLFENISCYSGNYKSEKYTKHRNVFEYFLSLEIELLKTLRTNGTKNPDVVRMCNFVFECIKIMNRDLGDTTYKFLEKSVINSLNYSDLPEIPELEYWR